MGHFSIRKIINERGEEVEVVRYETSDAPRSISDALLRAGDALHVCVECESELVQADAWERTGEHRWWVALRCPECDHARDGEFERGSVEAFDRVRNAARRSIHDDHEQLGAVLMGEWADVFVAALGVDAILPEDF